MAHRPQSHQTGELAEAIAREALVRAGWIVDRPESDYGYDLSLRAVTEEQVIPGLAFVQVKGTAQPRRASQLCYRINVEKLDEWIGNPIPIFLCLVDVLGRRLFIRTVRDIVDALRDKHGENWNNAMSRTVWFDHRTRFTAARNEHLRREVDKVWGSIGALGTHLRQVSRTASKFSAGAFVEREAIEFFDLRTSWTPGHARAMLKHLGMRLDFFRYADLNDADLLARALVAAYSLWHLPVVLMTAVINGDSPSKAFAAVRVKSFSMATERICTVTSPMLLSSDRIDRIEGFVADRPAILELHMSGSASEPRRWRLHVGTDMVQTVAITHGMIPTPVGYHVDFNTVLLDHIKLLPTVVAALGEVEWSVELVPLGCVPYKVTAHRRGASGAEAFWWRVSANLENVEVLASFCPADKSMRRRQWRLISRDALLRGILVHPDYWSPSRFSLAGDGEPSVRD